MPQSYGGRRGAASRGGQSRGGLSRLSEYGSDGDSRSSVDGASIATSMATLPRRKDETAEEKKARKGAVKEAKVGLDWSC